MKKFIFTLLLSLFFIGCGGGGSSDSVDNNSNSISKNGYVTFLKDSDSFVNYPDIVPDGEGGFVQAGNNFVAVSSVWWENYYNNAIINPLDLHILSYEYYNNISYVLYDGLYKYEIKKIDGTDKLVISKFDGEKYNYYSNVYIRDDNPGTRLVYITPFIYKDNDKIYIFSYQHIAEVDISDIAHPKLIKDVIVKDFQLIDNYRRIFYHGEVGGKIGNYFVVRGVIINADNFNITYKLPEGLIGIYNNYLYVLNEDNLAIYKINENGIPEKVNNLSISSLIGASSIGGGDLSEYDMKLKNGIMIIGINHTINKKSYYAIILDVSDPLHIKYIDSILGHAAGRITIYFDGFNTIIINPIEPDSAKLYAYNLNYRVLNNNNIDTNPINNYVGSWEGTDKIYLTDDPDTYCVWQVDATVNSDKTGYIKKTLIDHQNDDGYCVSGEGTFRMENISSDGFEVIITSSSTALFNNSYDFYINYDSANNTLYYDKSFLMDGAYPAKDEMYLQKVDTSSDTVNSDLLSEVVNKKIYFNNGEYYLIIYDNNRFVLYTDADNGDGDYIYKDGYIYIWPGYSYETKIIFPDGFGVGKRIILDKDKENVEYEFNISDIESI